LLHVHRPVGVDSPSGPVSQRLEPRREQFEFLQYRATRRGEAVGPSAVRVKPDRTGVGRSW